MKLRTLRIEPQGSAGWSSEELIFGEHITQLYGPNGCGKTPIIQSISYALGFPVKFRDDVVKNCAAVTLTLEEGGATYQIRRVIKASGLEIEVRNADVTSLFLDESDYSTFLFEVFGFDRPALTSTRNDPVFPYMATLLPIFYLDQDHGYSVVYRPPAVFIKDQYAEMMRLVFGLPPKHSFDQKKRLIEKENQLDKIDRLIVTKRAMIESLTRDLGGVRRLLQEVESEVSEITTSLDRFKESRSLRSDAHLAIDTLIYDKQTAQKYLENEISELQSRVDGFEKIRNEIEVEANTLSLNEEAQRLFSSFKDICAKADCGLLRGSLDSYGKNLLYLRDQIKDLSRNTDIQRSRIQYLSREREALNAELSSLVRRREALTVGDEVSALVETIAQLARRLVDLQKEKHSLEELGNTETVFLELLNERDKLQNDLASMSGSAGAGDLRAIEVRSNWRARILYWMDALKTKNVSRELSVDSNFDILFGGEKITRFKGSTLVRVVLAIHTATFELYVKDPNKRLRFMILDTPRQQDIEREVLSNYVSKLKEVLYEHNAQVVFSTTNYHYECADGDTEWSPTFPGPEQNMFLGTISKN